MKNVNFLGFSPNGFNIPQKVVMGYLFGFGIPVAVLAFFGAKVASMLILCIGVCAFVLTDVLLEQRKAQHATVLRRVHGLVTCCFTGAAIVLCVIKLISEF